MKSTFVMLILSAFCLTWSVNAGGQCTGTGSLDFLESTCNVSVPCACIPPNCITRAGNTNCAASQCVDNDTECCDQTCNGFPCGTWGVIKSNPQAIACDPGTVSCGSSCAGQESICCDRHTCQSGGQMCSTSGRKQRASWTTIVCTSNSCLSDEGICCENKTCDIDWNSACTSNGRTGKGYEKTGDPACINCDESECCNAAILCSSTSGTFCNGYGPKIGTNVCNFSGCTTAICCGSAEMCNTQSQTFYSCPSGQLSTSASSTSCPGGTCDAGDAATCCEPFHYCSERTAVQYGCTSTVLVSNAGTTQCPGNNCLGCSNCSNCCEAAVQCSSFGSAACTSWATSNGSGSTAAIINNGGSNCTPNNICTATQCCVETCSSGTYNCPSNYSNKGGTITCSSGICDTTTCCNQDDQCSDFHALNLCTAVYMQNNGAVASSYCNTKNACERLQCCNNLDCRNISSATCSADNNYYSLMSSPQGKTCASNIACTLAECCIPQNFCSSFSTCSSTCQSQISNASTTKCTSNVCTASTCCDTLTCACYGSSCSGFQLKPNPSSLICPGGNCTKAFCCNPDCSSFGSAACVAVDKALRPSPTSIECSNNSCTEAICCYQLRCSSFDCTTQGVTGLALRSNAYNTVCTSDVCDKNQCCASVSCSANNFSCPTTSTRQNASLCGVINCTSSICCRQNCWEYSVTGTCKAQGAYHDSASRGFTTCSGEFCNVQNECCSPDATCASNAPSCNPPQGSLKTSATTCTEPTNNSNLSGQSCSYNDCCQTHPLCGNFNCSPSGNLNCGTNCAVPRSNMSVRSCTSMTCSQSDCCDRKDTCNNYNCPSSAYYPKQARTFMCATATCQLNECCEPKLNCASWNYNCPSTLRPYLDMASHTCSGTTSGSGCWGGTETCTAAYGHNCNNSLCCVNPVNCPAVANDPTTSSGWCTGNGGAYVFQTNPIGQCTYDTCSKNFDQNVCCGSRGQCNQITCNSGTVYKNNYLTIQCAFDKCNRSLTGSNNNECCGPQQTCLQANGQSTTSGPLCPAPDANMKNGVSNFVCATTVCQFSECCQTIYECKVSVSGWTGVNACAQHLSPTYINSPNFATTYCRQPVCTAAECCSPKAHCIDNGGYPCPNSMFLPANKKGGAGYLCASYQCTDAECCIPKWTCGSPAPNGFVCTGSTMMRDLAAVCQSDNCTALECCVPLAKCSSFTNTVLPAGWTWRADVDTVDCQSSGCDIPTCCDRDVTVTDICNNYIAQCTAQQKDIKINQECSGQCLLSFCCVDRTVVTAPTPLVVLLNSVGTVTLVFTSVATFDNPQDQLYRAQQLVNSLVAQDSAIFPGRVIVLSARTIDGETGTLISIGVLPASSTLFTGQQDAPMVIITKLIDIANASPLVKKTVDTNGVDNTIRQNVAIAPTTVVQCSVSGLSNMYAVDQDMCQQLRNANVAAPEPPTDIAGIFFTIGLVIISVVVLAAIAMYVQNMEAMPARKQHLLYDENSESESSGDDSLDNDSEIDDEGSSGDDSLD